MTKKEAIKAMGKGHKVTHRLFTADEWMTVVGDLFEFEDGCKCPFQRFWHTRMYDEWLDGWSIYVEGQQ